MSIRFDASGDILKRTTSLPSLTNFTACGWLYTVTNRNYWSTVFGLEDALTSAAQQCLYAWNDTTPSKLGITVGGGSNPIFTTSPSVGDWAFWAFSDAGTGANQVTGYLLLPGATTFQVVTGTRSSFTPAQMVAGNNSYGDELINGRLDALRVWDAVLTADELFLEVWSKCAVRRANLHLETPMADRTLADNYVDISGNGKDWTAGGTLTVEDGSPVRWIRGRRPTSYEPSGGGGTTYNDSVTESLTAAESSAGAMVAIGARTEALTVADSHDATATGADTVADSLTVTAAQSSSATFVAATTETLAATDTQAGAFVAIGARAETLTATESAAGAFVAIGARTETLTVADSHDATVTGADTIVDSLTVTAAQNAIATMGAATTETLAATDTHTGTFVVVVARVETLTATATQDAGTASSAARAESLTVLDLSDATVGPTVVILETQTWLVPDDGRMYPTPDNGVTSLAPDRTAALLTA